MNKLQPGQMLGPYRIINEVGSGGMATVYKAYQASMDRNVAIKVLPGQLAESEEFVKRFQQEARIIARLEHPYILPVFDYGEEDGVAYFVMRYLEAGTLKDKMKVRPLSLEEIDRIFTQLTDALGYAHAQGVIHRDLKPANALIDSSGNLFLTDFGIAKLLESASPRLTQTDAILGTPAYISPEQAAALTVDQRSDIYSLGIILYEMVTGRVPFVADTPLAVILKHLGDPLPPPSSLKPDIPPGIEQVVLKSLAKKPEDRFANTAEFLSAWKQALAGMDTISSINTMVDSVSSMQTVVDQMPIDATMTDRLPKVDSSQSSSQYQPPATSQPVSKKALTGLAVGCVALFCIVLSGFGIFRFASNMFAPAPSVPVVESSAPMDVSTPELEVPVIPAATILLQDDFSQTAATWGTGTDSNGSIQYDTNTLRFIVSTDDWFTWSVPNNQAYSNVRMEVNAFNNGTDQFTAFGLMCNLQADGRSFYYFAITPAGQYVIARTSANQSDAFLTNNGQWGDSGMIPRNASSYRLGADCGKGTLTLYVDGVQIASVADTTYTAGGVGLFVWSAAQASRTDISFDDFLLTDIP